METVQRLLKHLFEEAKDNLLVANPQTFAAFQGEAMAFKRLHDLINQPPLTEEQRRGGV